MTTIVLHLDARATWSPMQWASGQEAFPILGRDGYFLQREPHWMRIERYDRVLEDYDVKERTEVESAIAQPTSYYVECSDVALIDELLRDVPEAVPLLIDNDHGVIADSRTLIGIAAKEWLRRTVAAPV